MEGFSFSTGTLAELSGVSPFTGLDAQIGEIDQSGQYIFAVADVPNSTSLGMFAYGVDTTSRSLDQHLAHAGSSKNELCGHGRAVGWDEVLTA